MSYVFVHMAYGANQRCDKIYRNPKGEYVLKWKDEDGEVVENHFVPERRVLYYEHVDEEEDDE